MISKCPPAELLSEYKEIKDIKTVDEMTADQFWVKFHVDECENCKNLIEA